MAALAASTGMPPDSDSVGSQRGKQHRRAAATAAAGSGDGSNDSNNAQDVEKRSLGKNWAADETRLLIRLRTEHDAHFTHNASNLKVDALWEKFYTDIWLPAGGSPRRTAKNMHDKFSNLRKRYRAAIDPAKSTAANGGEHADEENRDPGTGKGGGGSSSSNNNNNSFNYTAEMGTFFAKRNSGRVKGAVQATTANGAGTGIAKKAGSAPPSSINTSAPPAAADVASTTTGMTMPTMPAYVSSLSVPLGPLASTAHGAVLTSPMSSHAFYQQVSAVPLQPLAGIMRPSQLQPGLPPPPSTPTARRTIAPATLSQPTKPIIQAGTALALPTSGTPMLTASPLTSPSLAPAAPPAPVIASNSSLAGQKRSFGQPTPATTPAAKRVKPLDSASDGGDTLAVNGVLELPNSSSSSSNSPDVNGAHTFTFDDYLRHMIRQDAEERQRRQDEMQQRKEERELERQQLLAEQQERQDERRLERDRFEAEIKLLREQMEHERHERSEDRRREAERAQQRHDEVMTILLSLLNAKQSV
ncbi:hypothetical protein RI367_002739 [Sorochytrium milnesiophthora]